MRKIPVQRLLKVCTATLVCSLFVGCGSSSNDQGVSFTHLGFFQPLEDEEIECEDFPAGLTGLAVPVGSTSSAGEFLSGSVVATVGAQNSLTGQALRVETMELDYEVSGSSLKPPSTVVPLPLLLGPGTPSAGASDEDSETSGSGDSSLPGSFGTEGICFRGFAESLILTSDVRTWFNLNANKLPSTPFTVFVTSRLNGVTTAGKRFVSNDSVIFIEMVSGTPINPGQAGSEE